MKITYHKIPIRPVDHSFHDYNGKGKAVMQWQSSCIVPGCNSGPRTIYAGCTRDVTGIVFVCKPSARKWCRHILHQARAPNPVDAQGNTIEKPTLVRKRKQNETLGSERIPKRLRKSLTLNPHHVGWIVVLEICKVLCIMHLTSSMKHKGPFSLSDYSDIWPQNKWKCVVMFLVAEQHRKRMILLETAL